MLSRSRHMWAIGGSSPITSGLLSYGVLWVETASFNPRKWFMVINGVLTVLFGVAGWFWLPDSPINARFLTMGERA